MGEDYRMARFLSLDGRDRVGLPEVGRRGRRVKEATCVSGMIERRNRRYLSRGPRTIFSASDGPIFPF